VVGQLVPGQVEGVLHLGLSDRGLAVGADLKGGVNKVRHCVKFRNMLITTVSINKDANKIKRKH
jgi:hypothetical protein